jgi:hypothetical protein
VSADSRASESLFDVVNGCANHPGLPCKIRHTQPGFLASAAQKFPKVRRGRRDDLSLFDQGLFRNRLHKTPLCSLHRIGQNRRAFLTDCAGLDGSWTEQTSSHIQAKPQRIANVYLGFPLLSLCPWMNLLFLATPLVENCLANWFGLYHFCPDRSQCRCKGVSVVIRQSL